MGFKSKAAVVVSGALTAGAFATLAAAMPAGAATFGTEQSEAGQVFAVAGSTIVGASHTGQNTEFSQSVRGNTVIFRTGNNRCVADTFGGLGLQPCNNNSRWQRFDEVGGFGPYTALQNEGSRQYVQDNGRGNQITTVSVRSWGRNHRQNFSRDQLWRWTDFNMGGGWPGGGPNPGGPGRGGNPPAQRGTWTASTRVIGDADSGHGNPSLWADLNFTRVASIKLTGSAPSTDCGGASPCYAYTGTLDDENGTLTTVLNAGSPNQAPPYAGDTETHVKHGTFHGSIDVTFYANSNRPNANYVAKTHNDGDQHPSSPSVYSVTDWVEQFFADGTNFGTAGPQTGAYDYFYTAGNQNWEDSSTNGDGNLTGDGNIYG